MSALLLATLSLLAALACNASPPVRACGPGEPCPSAEQQCVWLPNEGRGYCAPRCGEEGTCPEGLVCRQVAPGECYPCRVEAFACVEPD